MKAEWLFKTKSKYKDQHLSFISAKANRKSDLSLISCVPSRVNKEPITNIKSRNNNEQSLVLLFG